MNELGCGDWRAFITCRGGGELFELPYTALSGNRKLDDVSEANVTISAGMLDSLSPKRKEECCGLLADLEPWAYELALWRDSELEWCGPILKPVWRTYSVTILARDLLQWFERRILERDRDWVGEDLADIWHQIAVDALHRDPSPNIELSWSPTGVVGDRSVVIEAKRRAADEMRELMRAGLDVTTIGRRVIAGGTEIPTADLGTLGTHDFDNPEASVDGLQTETESHVVGARTDTVLGPVSAVAGAPIVNGVRTVDPVRGLVQNVVTEQGIEDEDQALAAAESRQAYLNETPTVFRGRLLSTAPVHFGQLIPGATSDLRVQLLCKEIIGTHRLQTMEFSVTDGNVESVVPTFTSLGTALE